MVVRRRNDERSRTDEIRAVCYHLPRNTNAPIRATTAGRDAPKPTSMRRGKMELHKIRSGQFHRLYQGHKPTCPVKPAAYKYTKTPSPIPNPTLCLMNGIRIIIIAQRFNFVDGAFPALA